MRKVIILIALLAACGTAQAQQANGTGQATSGSNAGATAGNTNNFAAAEQRGSINTTPSAYVPPSMFGGANNCGYSDSMAFGITGMVAGGSKAGESVPCNARQDASVAVALGLAEVARMRFFCFGEDANRKAFEATGYLCPATATAKGLADNVAAAPGSYMP